MNHLLETWITWIKYKPYFTARTNSKLNALMVWRRGAKKGETKKDLWGGTLCQSEGGGVVKTLTSGIHICERLREEPELEIRREMDSNEKGKKRERWREQRQWLIHEQSHVLNFLKELGGMREGGLLKMKSHSRHHSAWETKKMVCLTHCLWAGMVAVFEGGEAKTREETAGEDRVSNQEKVTKWLEVNRWWGGEEGGGETSWRGDGPCNNKMWKQARDEKPPKFLLHAIFPQRDSNPSYSWTLLLPLQKLQVVVGVCVCVCVCVCVIV